MFSLKTVQKNGKNKTKLTRFVKKDILFNN